MKIYEFLEDLKYYYKDGPAYNITAEMTQPLIGDIIKKMITLREGFDRNKNILNFAHEKTVLPFLTALGLYQDKKDILASDWPRKDHLWKTSKIGSFASNVGILVLKCEIPKTREENSSEKIVSSEEADSSEEQDSSQEQEERLIDLKENDDRYDWKVMVFHQLSNHYVEKYFVECRILLRGLQIWQRMILTQHVLIHNLLIQVFLKNILMHSSGCIYKIRC